MWDPSEAGWPAEELGAGADAGAEVGALRAEVEGLGEWLRARTADSMAAAAADSCRVS